MSAGHVWTDGKRCDNCGSTDPRGVCRSDLAHVREQAAPTPTVASSDVGSNAWPAVEGREQVDHPRHYNTHPSGVECITIIEHLTFNVGSAVKYLWRAGLKDSEPALTDLKKAAWYIAREIERVEKK